MKNLILILLFSLVVVPAFSISVDKSRDTVISFKTLEPRKDARDGAAAVIVPQKLTFFEKVSFVFFKKKFRIDPLTPEQITKANNHASTGLIFGILGIFLLPILSIPGLIFSSKALRTEKLNPNTLTPSSYSMARTGKVMSWIGLAFLSILFVYVLVLIAVSAS